MLPGLFSASRVARDFVLQAALNAELSLSLSSGTAQAEWERQLNSAAECLRKRGVGLPTTLRLQVKDSTISAACLAALAPALQEANAGAGVTALALSWGSCQVGAAYNELLGSTLAALPNLRSLSLDRCMGPLDPQLLPHLTELNVVGEDTDSNAFYVSVGKLVTQLTALGYEGFEHEVRPPWQHIFTPTTTTRTLTSLTVSQLDDTLLPLLLIHAPALQHIDVEFLNIYQSYRDQQWGVKRVYIPESWGVSIECVLRLPHNENCGRHTGCGSGLTDSQKR